MAKKTLTAKLMAQVRAKLKETGEETALADWLEVPLWRLREWVYIEKYDPNGEIALSLHDYVIEGMSCKTALEATGRGGLRHQVLFETLNEMLPKNQKGQTLTESIAHIYSARNWRTWRNGAIPRSEPCLALLQFLSSH